MKTTDLADQYPDSVQIAEDIGLRHFGACRQFQGHIVTLRCFEDNALLKQLLADKGEGRVIVVDGDASRRCALLGDQLAATAVRNGWAGVVVHGCIRDCAAIGQLPLGVMAMGAVPRRGGKSGQGVLNEVLRFANVAFEPQHWLCADEDGIIVAPRDLTKG